MFMFVLLLLLSVSYVSCDGTRVCSWISSEDPVPHQTNTVRIVSVNCTEGKIDWKHPKGALLVVVSPPDLELKNVTWKLCIRPTSKYNEVLVSYLENGSPKPLIHNGNPSTNVVFCTETNLSSLTLYIELKAGSKIYLSRASFYYTIVKNLTSSFIKLSDQQRLQCQPCQTKYLLESFCSADLVFKGVLSSNGDDYMRFTIEKFVRKPITIEESEVFTKHKEEIKMQALIRTPDHCVLPKNVESMEFLVVAKTLLGRAHALCVPLWSDWLNVRHKILAVSPSSPLTLPPCDVT